MTIVTAHVKRVPAAKRAGSGDDHVLSVHEAAHRTTTALDLDDRRRHGLDRVRQLIRKIPQKFVAHVRIVAERKPTGITQKGGV